MRPHTPEIVKLPARTVLTVTTVGTPSKTAQRAMQALYGTAYGTKFKVFKPKQKDMKIGMPSAFWPDALTKPKSRWTAIWNLEVPAFVQQKDLLQKDPTLPVKIGKLKAGTYGQILHIGPYDKEERSVTILQKLLKAQKMKIAGPHEEVYLSRPGPKARTIIRYLVKKKQR